MACTHQEPNKDLVPDSRKSILRAQLAPLPGVTISTDLAKRWASHLQKPVLAYLPLRGEVDIRPLLELLPVVYVPAVDAQYRIVGVTPWHDQSSLRDCEVSHASTISGDALTTIERVLVPGMGFDLSGRRLGRGKGSYDRFLLSNPRLYRIGVLTATRLMLEIPTQAHDISMDELWIVGADGSWQQHLIQTQH